MLLIVLILFIAMIVVPLCDLTLKETSLFFIKLVIYLLATIFILWSLFAVKGAL